MTELVVAADVAQAPASAKTRLPAIDLSDSVLAEVGVGAAGSRF